MTNKKIKDMIKGMEDSLYLYHKHEVEELAGCRVSKKNAYNYASDFNFEGYEDMAYCIGYLDALYQVNTILENM
jgi:hypothetical protein